MIIRSLASKAGHLLGVLLGASLLTYFLMDLLPGDAAEITASLGEDPDPNAVENLREAMGLNRPFIVRYCEWLGNAVTGDLGTSFRTNREVWDSISERLPVTLELMVIALVLSLAIAIPLAVASARHRDSPFDKIASTITFGMQAVPNFVVALAGIAFFAVMLGILPALGYVPFDKDPVGNIRSLVIPALALSSGLVPLFTRVLRNEMIRVLQEDHVLAARSLGLSTNKILYSYALKPALPTLVTVVGVSVGNLVGGTIIIELISGIPGLGTLLYNAINYRDYVLVQGIIFFVAIAYVVINFVVDVIYTLLDPRVRA